LIQNHIFRSTAEVGPGARQVVEVDDARLFFPEDRPESLTGPMLRFWDELAKP
jgi:hypothetical protein